MSAFNGKVAIVTGATLGIGLATAVGFANTGAKVLVTGRNQERLNRVTADHESIEGILADVGKPEDARRTIEYAIRRWGKLDILVNNAGAGAVSSLSDIDVEALKSILAVNIIGPCLLAKEALPHLTVSRGTIINVSSTYGHKAGVRLSHYAASKAALEHLTRCWALELAGRRIRVNAVAAGPTDTGALIGMMGLSVAEARDVEEAERRQNPLGRRGRPDDVSRWILALADATSDWVTGQIVSVDGGLSLT